MVISRTVQQFPGHVRAMYAKECTLTTKRLTGDFRKKFTAHDGIVPSEDHYNPVPVSVVDEASPSLMQYTGNYPTIIFRLLLMPRATSCELHLRLRTVYRSSVCTI